MKTLAIAALVLFLVLFATTASAFEQWPPEEITFCRVRDNKTGECIMIGECGVAQPTPKECNRYIRRWKRKGWK